MNVIIQSARRACWHLTPANVGQPHKDVADIEGVEPAGRVAARWQLVHAVLSVLGPQQPAVVLQLVQQPVVRGLAAAELVAQALQNLT